MEEVLKNNIVEYLSNDEFIHCCGTLKKDMALDLKRRKINSKYCCDALKSILREFKFYELDTRTEEDDTSAFELIDMLSRYLLMNTNIYLQIQNYEKRKNKKREKYIQSPTIVNLIKYPDTKPSYLLEFSEHVKEERHLPHICPTYRMHPWYKNLLCRHYKYAQALIY